MTENDGPTLWWLCCGWSSPWCMLDAILRCRVKWVCRKHDQAIGVDQ